MNRIVYYALLSLALQSTASAMEGPALVGQQEEFWDISTRVRSTPLFSKGASFLSTLWTYGVISLWAWNHRLQVIKQ